MPGPFPLAALPVSIPTLIALWWLLVAIVAIALSLRAIRSRPSRAIDADPATPTG